MAVTLLVLRKQVLTVRRLDTRPCTSLDRGKIAGMLDAAEA